MMIDGVSEAIREAPINIFLKGGIGMAALLASGPHRHVLGFGTESQEPAVPSEGPEAP